MTLAHTLMGGKYQCIHLYLWHQPSKIVLRQGDFKLNVSSSNLVEQMSVLLCIFIASVCGCVGCMCMSHHQLMYTLLSSLAMDVICLAQKNYSLIYISILTTIISENELITCKFIYWIQGKITANKDSSKYNTRNYIFFMLANFQWAK